MSLFYIYTQGVNFITSQKKTHQNYTDQAWNLSDSIRDHDAIVSSFLYQICKLEEVSEAHLTFSKGEVSLTDNKRAVVPDGFFVAYSGDLKVNVALEIELNRKNRKVIESKFDSYYGQDIYGVVLYVFNDDRIREAYWRFHKEYLRENGISYESAMMIFASSEDLGDSNMEFLELERITMVGQIGLVKDVFFTEKKRL